MGAAPTSATCWWLRLWNPKRRGPRRRQLAGMAVEARYEEGPFPLPAARTELLALLELELGRCERAVVAMG